MVGETEKAARPRGSKNSGRHLFLASPVLRSSLAVVMTPRILFAFAGSFTGRVAKTVGQESSPANSHPTEFRPKSAIPLSRVTPFDDKSAVIFCKPPIQPKAPGELGRGTGFVKFRKPAA